MIDWKDTSRTYSEAFCFGHKWEAICLDTTWVIKRTDHTGATFTVGRWPTLLQAKRAVDRLLPRFAASLWKSVQRHEALDNELQSLPVGSERHQEVVQELLRVEEQILRLGPADEDHRLEA